MAFGVDVGRNDHVFTNDTLDREAATIDFRLDPLDDDTARGAASRSAPTIARAGVAAQAEASARVASTMLRSRAQTDIPGS